MTNREQVLRAERPVRDPHAVIAAATAIAAEHHEGQLHGAGTAMEVPILVHVMEVAVVTRRLRHLVADRLTSPAHVLFAAGLLHDVPEDSPKGRAVAAREVLEACGEDVAGIVGRITDVEAPDRKTSKAATLPIIAQCVDTTYLKVCDRYVNQDCTLGASSLRFARLYGSEYPDFKAALYPTLPCDELWAVLDGQQAAMLELVESANERRAVPTLA